jgi:hypothetical protein
MLKLLFLGILIAAAALFLGTTPQGKKQEMPPASTEPYSMISREQAEAILHRRSIFCKVVEEVKAELSRGMNEREILSFELLSPQEKWLILHPYLHEKGCPALEKLLKSLALGSVGQIEFGSLGGSVQCSIPDYAGFTLPTSQTQPEK